MPEHDGGQVSRLLRRQRPARVLRENGCLQGEQQNISVDAFHLIIFLLLPIAAAGLFLEDKAAPPEAQFAGGRTHKGLRDASVYCLQVAATSRARLRLCFIEQDDNDWGTLVGSPPVRRAS